MQLLVNRVVEWSFFFWLVDQLIGKFNPSPKSIDYLYSATDYLYSATVIKEM